MIKDFFKKLVLGKKYSSETYLNYLRSIGITIGHNVKIIDVRDFIIDTSRPFLIEIGNDVTFSDHVTIMTHDYSWSIVSRAFPGEIYPIADKVTIGNNVFIGTHATILKGVTIGDNAIVGAGSIVTRDVEPNMVYAGSPAKPIMTLEEYKEKIKAKSERHLRTIIREYRKKNPGKEMDEKYIKEHMAWYKTREEIMNCSNQYYTNRRMDSLDREINKFDSINELINYYSD